MTGRESEERLVQPVWERLSDQVLVHAKAPAGDRRLIPGLDFENGVVLCGARAADATRALHAADVEAVLLDHERYEQLDATAEHPFRPPHYDPTELALFAPDDPLQECMDSQHRLGVTAALTPTGHLRADAVGALQAVVRGAHGLNQATDILVVPLDAEWLADDARIARVIAELDGVPHLKALVLSAVRDPLRKVGSATRLRRLVSSVDRVALLRTDLAGLDALAHGAVFATIGINASTRHGRPPGAPPPRQPKGKRTRSATVLHPRLMQYFHSETLDERYGYHSSPVCDCVGCDGRRLGSFSGSPEDIARANRHNLAIWSMWANELQALPNGSQRRHAWRRRCRDALQAHEELNAFLGPHVFEPTPALKEWAD